MASTQESSANPDRMPVSRLVAVRALRAPGQIENSDHRLVALNAKLIGQSQAMQALKKSILTAASCISTVLITRQLGPDRELYILAIHELMPGSDEPFLA